MIRLFDPFGDFLGLRESVPYTVSENQDGITITLDLPGVTEKDIKVGVEDSVLSVRAERSKGTIATYSYSWSLPRAINVDAVDASYENGVLTLMLPKREESKPRQIAVKAAKQLAETATA